MSHEEVVKIVSVDKLKIRESATVKGTWVLPFKLSITPDETWARNFYEVHRKNTDPKKKEIKLSGDCLEVNFTDADDLQKTLDNLKLEVDKANVDYQELVDKKLRVQEEMRVLQKKQSDTMQKLKDDSDGLKF
jgi:hypothetical protein